MAETTSDAFVRIEELLTEVEALGCRARVQCYTCLRELRWHGDFYRDEARKIICWECSERMALDRQERQARRAEAIRRLPPA